MNQNAGPLDVPQKLVPQARAGMGPFNEPRNIGEHKMPIQAHLHHAKVRILRRKRIIGNLRPGFRQSAQERALAGVGFADDADVGDDLQFEEQLSFFTFASGRMIARGAIRRRLEPRVSFARFATLGGDDLISLMRQITQDKVILGVEHQSAGGYLKNQIVAVLARFVRPAAVRAVARLPEFLMRKAREIIDAVAGDDDHAPSFAAVAAVRAAAGDVLLPPEAHAAIAAVAGLDFDLNAVDEHVCAVI